MLDKNHVVDVPNGAIVRSNRIVLWTVGKNYIGVAEWKISQAIARNNRCNMVY